MAVSIVINVSVLTIGAILGTSVLSMLPDTIKAALNYLLPALFWSFISTIWNENEKTQRHHGCICDHLIFYDRNGIL